MSVPTDFLKRHVWLCETLRENRLRDDLTFERRASDAQSPVGIHLADATNWAFFEIISDGGGQAEPYWHGLTGNPGEYRLLSPEERDELGAGIATRREHHRQKFQVVADTHRDLGRYFSEPLVFCLRGRRDGNGYNAEQHITVLTPRGPATWMEFAGTRLSAPGDTVEFAKSLEQDLRVLCEHVLWPEFWMKHPELESFLSVMYIQGSIMQTDCGVWAIHFGASGIDLNDLGPKAGSHPFYFIDPAEHCLHHVLVSEVHRSGFHKRRISDLHFVGRALAPCGAPLGSEIAIYRFLNAEVDLDQADERHPVAASEFGHQLYTRSHQADYLVDYTGMFEVCVARLALIDPAYIRGLEHPLFRSLSVLFVARRVQELQYPLGQGHCSQLPDCCSPLATMLLRMICPTCVTINCTERHQLGEPPRRARTWSDLLKRILEVALKKNYENSFENRSVNAALWALAALSTKHSDAMPHDLELRGTPSDWKKLRGFLDDVSDG